MTNVNPKLGIKIQKIDLQWKRAYRLNVYKLVELPLRRWSRVVWVDTARAINHLTI